MAQKPQYICINPNISMLGLIILRTAYALVKLEDQNNNVSKIYCRLSTKSKGFILKVFS